MSTQISTNSMTQNTAAPTSTTTTPPAADDGSKQLAWIIVGVMMLFASLTVVSYNEKPASTPSVKQTETQWKAPKQVSAPVVDKDQLPVTNESAPKIEPLKGRGELIQA